MAGRKERKKRVGMRRVAFMLKTLFATFAITCCVLVGCDSRIPFDSKVWKAAIKGDDGPRSRMVDSVVAKLVKGTSQSEVQSLLGPPDADSKSRKSGCVGITAPFDAYETRTYRGMIDYDTDFLIIEYDSENKVLRSYVITVQG